MGDREVPKHGSIKRDFLAECWPFSAPSSRSIMLFIMQFGVICHVSPVPYIFQPVNFAVRAVYVYSGYNTGVCFISRRQLTLE